MKSLFAPALSLLALAAAPAGAVHLNPRGLGQVLLYPYYSVNRHQQTLLSVVNTTAHGKALRVVFHEGRNGREVLDFELLLAPHDTWTATVFAPTDTALPGAGAAFTTSDTSCIAPTPGTWTGRLPNDAPYQRFLEYGYVGYADDGGPTDLGRTREGYVEVFEMAEIGGATLARITPVGGVRADCTNLVPLPDLHPPGGGLYGAAALIDPTQGTLLPYVAEALDEFSVAPYYSETSADYDLARAYSGAPPGGPVARADVAVAGGWISTYYPTDGERAHSRAIDAVSAVLAADAVYAEYDIDAAAGARSDWILTFPTKRYYTDPLALGGSSSAALEPFVETFGRTEPGRACVTYGLGLFDREARVLAEDDTGWPEPPPRPRRALCTAVTVVTQQTAAEAAAHAPSPVVASTLLETIEPIFAHGHVALVLDPAAEPHALRPDRSGRRLRGLPVIGFMAVNYVNGNVLPNLLSNYSAALPLRTHVTCRTADDAACP